MAKILVVDDERPIRALVRVALERDDHQVFEAANGRVGLDLFKERPVDLIITDLMMPEMNGFDLISALATSAINVKVIAMTGDSASFHRLVTAKLLTTSQILLKPFDLDKLLNIVRHELTQ